jgi:lipopolysaccharide/colanic/teichoic acid biosynthesis glycosyltransferase
MCLRVWTHHRPTLDWALTQHVAKRLFDLGVAALALVVLAPAMCLIALWIKFDSKGPVFFRQERVGQHGRLFRIHKFRSMHADAAGLPLSVGDDARVTRAGAWLRRTRLDELPQLFDVLRGRMSLVGPRPEVPRYVAFYPPHLREQALAVRPGITDPASLEFLDEASQLAQAVDAEREYIDHILPIKLQRAADYARQACLRSDLLVLWRTVCALWRRM